MASIIVLRFHFRGHKTYKLPLLLRNIFLMPLPTTDPFEASSHYLERNTNWLSLTSLCERLKRNPSKTIQKDKSYSATIILILKSIEKTNRLIYNKKKEREENEKNLREWKEAARKIDTVMFVITAVTVTVTPILLFIKYFFELTIKLNDTCNIK